jgi:hypothetical protein
MCARLLLVENRGVDVRRDAGACAGRRIGKRSIRILAKKTVVTRAIERASAHG